MIVDLINTDTRHLNLGQCKKTDNWNLQNLIYVDLEQISSSGSPAVTMDGLHTEAPVLPEGRPGGVTLTGAVLAGEGHGLRALARSDMTI